MRVLGTWAIVGAAALLASCGGQDQADTAASGEAATTVPAPAPTDAEKQAILASLPAPYNTADLENGRRTFALCRSCHTLNEGGSNMTGPNLYGVIGDKAAVGDFKYSDALKAANIVWTPETLHPWLESPRQMVPGNKMAFAGVKDEAKRNDLIAYLMVETGYKPAS